MLSHQRLFLLIDTYGADPQRWPESTRAEAEAQLRICEPAQAHIELARSLDAAIREAARMADADLWAPGGQEAALARVRSLVGSSLSIPSAAVGRTAFLPPLLSAGWFAVLAPRRRGLGLAVGASLAIAVGFFVGSAQVAVATSHNVIAIFQPALLHVVTD